jgi:hypothetical protein
LAAGMVSVFSHWILMPITDMIIETHIHCIVWFAGRRWRWCVDLCCMCLRRSRCDDVMCKQMPGMRRLWLP